jgi:hypothetical protein
MNRLSWSQIAWLGMVSLAGAAPPAMETVQGLYEGTLDNQSEPKLEARVVAWGRDIYKVYVRKPLAEGKVAKIELNGKTDGNTLRFTGKADGADWTATYAEGVIKGTYGQAGTVQLKRIVRESPTLGAKPPEGAIVLLGGTNFDEVTKSTTNQWKMVEGGGIQVPRNGMNSRRRFDGSLKIHVEFRLPLMPAARDQERANSGVYLPCGQEIQVLDSFGSPSYKGGGCGGLYAFKDPDVFDQFSLASLPPLQWQTYDIEYRVKKAGGQLTGKPKVTVLHNGLKIHDNFDLPQNARVGGFNFQDHGNPVQYRNIWVLPLADE